MKNKKTEKEERARRFNISLGTYYNWEKTKPELINIIELGLQKEKELSENIEVAEELYPMVLRLQKDLEELKLEIKK